VNNSFTYARRVYVYCGGGVVKQTEQTLSRIIYLLRGLSSVNRSTVISPSVVSIKTAMLFAPELQAHLQNRLFYE
jgi:hypothetical protein